MTLEPPLVLFCVDLRAPSLGGLVQSQHVAINVLASDQEEIARRFARPAEDTLSVAHHPARQSLTSRQPCPQPPGTPDATTTM
jgi:flavin reductase (DIM6/NTAB) family NADH-FMN oxidoreductase RutF